MNIDTQRKAYGETLVELGGHDERICVLDADLGKSTMGCLFKEKYPERYFEMGIAEQNMMSVAAGLSLMGKTPFVSTFAVFACGRAYDQLRQTIAIGKLNVKVCGSSAGLSDYGDGSTHQSVEDIALMRAIPNMTVLSPADGLECSHMVRWMSENPGPMYIRVNRNPLPVITEDRPFDPKRLDVLKEGNDIAVFATGVMVSRAIEAATMLANEGISVKVINVATIKPLNREAVISQAKTVLAVVCAEEHSEIGGLGGAIAEALREENKPIYFLGIKDCFGVSSRNYDDLLAYYNLTTEEIYRTVKHAYCKHKDIERN